MQVADSHPITIFHEPKLEKNLVVTWEQFEVKLLQLGAKVLYSGWRPDAVIGIGRGGWAVADALSRILDVSSGAFMCKSYPEQGVGQAGKLLTSDNVAFIGTLTGKTILVVDDLVEKGLTLKATRDFIVNTYQIKEADIKTAVVFCKTKAEFQPDLFIDTVEHDRWIFLPGEVYERVDISSLSTEDLNKISEDPRLAASILKSLSNNPREKMSLDQMIQIINK